MLHQDPFTLASFIAWLEKQPSDKQYDWFNISTCVVRQYLRAKGFEQPRPLSSVFPSLEAYWRVGFTQPWTYGAVLVRAREEEERDVV